MSDTFYSFMGDDYEAPITDVGIPAADKKHAEPEFKHANRQDLSKPYSAAGGCNAEVEQPEALTPRNGPECEFWRWYTGQQTNCEIAREFNRQFSKPVTDYAATKAQYVNKFKQLAGK